MDPILETYEDVARGKVPAPVDYNEYKRLLAKARKATHAADEVERRMAIDVAGAVGRDRGMGVVRLFLDDPSPAVRRHCVDLAVREGEHGLLVLRSAVSDDDPEIALEAVRWLRRALDPGSAGALRRILKTEHDALRAAAAELIGHIAGPGLVIALRPLLDSQNDAVRTAAEQAIERLEGHLPRDEPHPWWTEPADESYSAPTGTDLPESLPDDPEALLQLLGQVAPEHTTTVLDALEPFGPSKMGFIVRACRPNGDRERNIGAARLGRAWERRDWVVPLRRLLPDDDPTVRIAVADCLAVIGSPSVLIGVRQLLQAPQSAVRAAAVRALTALCEPSELVRFTSEVHHDEDPLVKAALVDAGITP